MSEHHSSEGNCQCYFAHKERTDQNFPKKGRKVTSDGTYPWKMQGKPMVRSLCDGSVLPGRTRFETEPRQHESQVCWKARPVDNVKTPSKMKATSWKRAVLKDPFQQIRENEDD